MIGLQTAYTAVQTAIPELSISNLAALFAINARNIFGLPAAVIKENERAELSIFTAKGKDVFNKEQNRSKSCNSAFIEKELAGKVLGTFNKNRLFVN